MSVSACYLIEPPLYRTLPVAARFLDAARLAVCITTVTAESAGRCKFTQLMTDHILSDEHWYMSSTVVYRDRMSNHVREDG